MGSVNPQNHKKCKSYSRYNEKFLDREISLWDNPFRFFQGGKGYAEHLAGNYYDSCSHYCLTR